MAALLVMALTPTLVFGAASPLPSKVRIGDAVNLEPDGTGSIPDASGEHWSYSQGVLTLDGFTDEYVICDGGTLTILLKGQNTLTLAAEAYEGNLIFTGSGTLTAGPDDGIFSSILVRNGTITFQLSPGGKVTSHGSKFSSRGALRAFYDDKEIRPSMASTDMITLGSGNKITIPQGGVVTVLENLAGSMEEGTAAVPESSQKVIASAELIPG